MSNFTNFDNVVAEDIKKTRTFATKVSIRFVDLIVTAFGVAAGLAWKDVIVGWFSKEGSLGFLNRGFFTVAVVITFVGVIVTMVRSYLPPGEFNSSAPLEITLTQKPSPSPVQAPVPSPVQAPVPSPVQAPVPSSVQAPVQAPVPSSMPMPPPVPSPVPPVRTTPSLPAYVPDSDANMTNYLLM